MENPNISEVLSKGTIDIEYALYRTFLQHPEYGLDGRIERILDCLQPNANPYLFTSAGNARATVSENDKLKYSDKDFIEYILSEAAIVYQAAQFVCYAYDQITPQQLDKMFPNFSVISTCYDKIAHSKDDWNSIVYYKAHPQELSQIVTSIVQSAYKAEKIYQPSFKNYAEQYRIAKAKQNNRFDQLSGLSDPLEKIRRDGDRLRSIRDVRTNNAAINVCEREVMMGTQLKKRHSEYALGGAMFAAQDVGKRRNNQEDSVVILQSPTNPKLRFLAVADGMGGTDYGEFASSYTLQELTKWFNTLPADADNYLQLYQQELCDKINEISREIQQRMGNTESRSVSGTTLVCALAGQDKTAIASVGDSRCYISKGDSLRQVNEDESLVWSALKGEAKMNHKVVTKQDIDDLRFNPNNNQITRYIGQGEIGKIQTHMLDNRDYDKLLLFSDGVTDLLGHDDIKFIASRTRPDQIAGAMVNAAVNSDAINYHPEENMRSKVPAGKDNATAAVLLGGSYGR